MPLRQLARVSGLVVFMGSLGLLGWWWATIAGRENASGGVRAALIDTLLFSAFALHHSVLARPWSKTLVARLVPADLLRTSYVWVASVLLAAMCLLWQPVGGTLYRATGVSAVLPGLVQLAGVAVGLLAVRRVSVRELAGLADPQVKDELESGGPYALVRHPLYLGWVLVFFGTAHMTVDRLLFAAVSTIYLLIAMPFEEAGLQRQFGSRYLEYRQTVRWRLIPYIH